MFRFKEFNIIEVLKLPIKNLIPIAIVTGAVLFLPEKILDKLYLNNFKDKWGFVISIVFLVSSVISAQEIFIKLYKLIENKIYIYRFKKIQPKILGELSLQEIVVIILIYESLNKTVFFPINNGIIVKLENKMVITKTALQCGVSNIVKPKFPYTLNTWVESLLKEKPEILEKYFEELEANKEDVRQIIQALDFSESYGEYLY